ncbi:MAG TPA: hypothetical protein VF069_03315 [Streptosporangiaceae bacterium]
MSSAPLARYSRWAAPQPRRRDQRATRTAIAISVAAPAARPAQPVEVTTLNRLAETSAAAPTSQGRGAVRSIASRRRRPIANPTQVRPTTVTAVPTSCGTEAATPSVFRTSWKMRAEARR